MTKEILKELTTCEYWLDRARVHIRAKNIKKAQNALDQVCIYAGSVAYELDKQPTATTSPAGE